MPLPAALAARLAKRGILAKNSTPSKIDSNLPEEEVIAEDYDDKKAVFKVPKSPLKDSDHPFEFTDEEIQFKIKGYPGCPNKYNVYHECHTYCKQRYGPGILTPDPNYIRLKTKMLLKFPLPDGWQEVYDAGTGRHYYWEQKTDLVSWLPPQHPRHVLSEPAAVLREEVKLAETDEEESESEEEASDEEEERVKDKRRKLEAIEKHRAKGRTKVKDNDLDPMDPAAYSDIPRGTWATGLEKKGDAKTGVDVTASGPLFQQRPYPSPGEILRSRGQAPPKSKPQVSYPELPEK